MEPMARIPLDRVNDQRSAIGGGHHASYPGRGHWPAYVTVLRIGIHGWKSSAVRIASRLSLTFRSRLGCGSGPLRYLGSDMPVPARYLLACTGRMVHPETGYP